MTNEHFTYCIEASGGEIITTPYSEFAKMIAGSSFLKIHYIKNHYPDVSLLVLVSSALYCASLITEAVKTKIE